MIPQRLHAIDFSGLKLAGQRVRNVQLVSRRLPKLGRPVQRSI